VDSRFHGNDRVWGVQRGTTKDRLMNFCGGYAALDLPYPLRVSEKRSPFPESLLVPLCQRGTKRDCETRELLMRSVVIPGIWWQEALHFNVTKRKPVCHCEPFSWLGPRMARNLRVPLRSRHHTPRLLRCSTPGDDTLVHVGKAYVMRGFASALPNVRDLVAAVGAQHAVPTTEIRVSR